MGENVLLPIQNWLDIEMEYTVGRDQTARKNQYRLTHAEECVLADGDEKADFIFSPWLPLKFALYRYDEDLKGEDLVVKKAEDYQGLKRLVQEVLPVEESAVQTLSRFFQVYATKENVMILPDKRAALARSIRPYCDFTPSFLRGCFRGGPFSDYFGNRDDVFENWVKSQHMEVFFKDREIKRENIRGMEFKDMMARFDGTPDDFEHLEDAVLWYLEILRERKELLEAGE